MEPDLANVAFNQNNIKIMRPTSFLNNIITALNAGHGSSQIDYSQASESSSHRTTGQHNREISTSSLVRDLRERSSG
jgi:hypothetical protein